MKGTDVFNMYHGGLSGVPQDADLQQMLDQWEQNSIVRQQKGFWFTEET